MPCYRYCTCRPSRRSGSAWGVEQAHQYTPTQAWYTRFPIGRPNITPSNGRSGFDGEAYNKFMKHTRLQDCLYKIKFFFWLITEQANAELTRKQSFKWNFRGRSLIGCPECSANQWGAANTYAGEGWPAFGFCSQSKL
jgi:hypothetical protein